MARVDTISSPSHATGGSVAVSSANLAESVAPDKALPLPSWLVKVYFIFPIVLYIPDAIFNYFVYSDGVVAPANANVLVQVSQVTLWAFMSIGVVGMAYLLSVLAPYHWSLGHRIQAVFCGLGVVVATAITTWNSLSFRSTGFQAFNTDKWAYGIWPVLQNSHISITMILVAVAPPFWGLFWAIVQPTQTNRSLRHLQESHAERLLKTEQDAELKRIRAESNAKVRAAQLRGMGITAAAARDQFAGLVKGKAAVESPVVVDADPAMASETGEESGGELAALPGAGESSVTPIPGRVLQYPSQKQAMLREAPAGRGDAQFFNNVAAPAAPTVRSAPSGSRAMAAQPPLLSDAHAAPAADPVVWPARRPPTPGDGIKNFFPDEDQMTGTTGPRAAVRRPGDNNPLFRGISEDLSARALSTVQEIYEELTRELNPDGAKKSMPRKEFIARLVQRLNVDEPTAQKLLDKWTKSRRSPRAARS